jgi:AraC family transcriptional regulator of arabinose operon
LDPRIQVLISTIQDKPSSRFDIQDLARLANISASRLRHLFKSQTGLSPAQYIKQVRMAQAAALLRTTFLSVKEIMNNVGIHNESYFSREFRNVHGLPPGQYRAARRQE